MPRKCRCTRGANVHARRSVHYRAGRSWQGARPDGRDLNRSFPGSAKGSLTGRVAHTFAQEIVLKSTHGIDLHTGSRPDDRVVIGRTNLPLVYEGDTTFQIARYGRKVAEVEKHVEQFQEQHETAMDSASDKDAAKATIA